MTPAPGFSILITTAAAGSIGICTGELACSPCLNADSVLAQQRRRATERLAS
jgi:hypothetical protein